MGVHLQSGATKAIKFTEKAKISNLQQYMKQMKVLGGLDHPNISKIYEVFESDTHYFFVTEYLSGGDLMDGFYEYQYPAYGEQEAATIIRQLLSALAYMHKRGIIHRNIRPANLLFTEKGKFEIKVIDFDCAGTDPREAYDIYSEGQGRTPNYCAPEIFKKEYTEKVDIWSVGVILHFLVTSHLPFDADEDSQVIENIMQGRKVKTGVWDILSPEL